MRYLVTGAQGFIGRYTVAELLRRDAAVEVVGLGRSPELPEAFTHSVSRRGVEQPAALPSELAACIVDPRYSYRQADMVDLDSVSRVIAECEPDVIIHLASTRREEGARRLIDGNIQGVRSLLEACGASVRRFVVGSSGGVYGTPIDLPLRETANCLPVDPYGCSKLAAEHFARVLCARSGIEFVAGRIFNVVGPGQEERHVCGRLGSEIAAIKQGVREPVISAGGLSATRDYVDVRDVAAAFAVLAEHGAPGEIYNIGSGIETSVGEILAGLLDAAELSNRVKIETDSNPPAGVLRHVASMDKSRAVGITSQFKLAESLKDVLCYYLNA